MNKKISLKLIVCLLALFLGKWMVACCGAAEVATAAMVLDVGTPWVVADAAGKPLGDEAGKLCGELLQFSSENRSYMEKLLGKAELLSPVAASGRRDFYQGHVLTQIQIHLQSLLALEASCQAMTAYGAGDKATAVAQAAAALEACNRLYSELHKAEYGKWAAWYAGEKLMGLERTRGRVENMLAALKGEPEPVRSPLWNDYHYDSFYQYQERFSKNFPLLYPVK